MLHVSNGFGSALQPILAPAKPAARGRAVILTLHKKKIKNQIEALTDLKYQLRVNWSNQYYIIIYVYVITLNSEVVCVKI